MRDGLEREAEVELAHGEVADQRDDEDGNKAIEQVEVLEHERVTQAADHAEPALLRERANNERDDKRDPERRAHRARALFRELEQRGHGDDEDQQRGHHSRQHAALRLVRFVRALERKALLRLAMPSRIPPVKPIRPTSALRSPPPRRSTMRSGQPRNASAPMTTNAPSTKRIAGEEPARAFEFLAGNAHDERAEHEANDLRADILHLCRAVQAHRAGNIAQKARDAEAHVRGVAERR